LQQKTILMGRRRPFFLIGLFLLIDLIVYPALHSLFGGVSPFIQSTITIAFWSFTAFTFAWFLFTLLSQDEKPHVIRRYVFSSIILIYVSKFLFAIFLLANDIIYVIVWGLGKVFSYSVAFHSLPFELLPATGLTLTLFLALSLIYGILFNPYNYKFYRTSITLPNLPDEFNGIKIVQLSDIHSGSFTKKDPLVDVVNKINEEKPDIIFFTGDLVNTHAKEFDPYVDIFKNLKAKYGIYSITGNHDYGDYAKWKSDDEKKKNFQHLIEQHSKVGWRLLMDENILIGTKEKIAIIGIQNWSGRRNFSKYGDLEKAYPGCENAAVKLLLSHDPSHWDTEVIKKYPDIDITFSGHTHGMQFGFEFGRFRFSPVQWVYKQWAGLYKHNNQYLYVNRGFGFIGYPGRVGILPEVTVMTLRKNK
jgi:uncharacterized protein